jgi:hypothetical protein
MFDSEMEQCGVRFDDIYDDEKSSSSHEKVDIQELKSAGELLRRKKKESVDDKMSDVASVRERTIDEMKIQTMYKVWNVLNTLTSNQQIMLLY